MARSPAWASALRRAFRLAQRRSNVVGIDYGYVYKDNTRLKTRGIRFHVAQKLPLSELPGEHVLPTEMDGQRCDVVEANYSPAGSPRAHCSPVQLGISVGNVERSSTGTLGLIVRDKHTDAPALMSNWHVLCGSPKAVVAERISQPGPLHLGSRPPRLAARLERWLLLDVGYDAAIALLNDDVAWLQQVFESTISVTGIEAPRNGMKLVKYGVTSGLTHAIVDGVAGAYQIDYSHYGDTKRWMDGIRLIRDEDHLETEISLGGDSGAAWLNEETGKVVALHFAGEDGVGPTAEYALAHPIAKVLDLLDVVLP